MKDLVIKNALLGGEITDITVKNGKISEIGKTSETGIDVGGNKIFAGLIDVHTHGCMGLEANNGNTPEIAHHMACHGTTAYLPTTSTVAIEKIYNAANIDINAVKGAKVLGFMPKARIFRLNIKVHRKKNICANRIWQNMSQSQICVW